MSKGSDFLKDFNERYFARLERQQQIAEKVAMLRHPVTETLHRPIPLRSLSPGEEGAGFCGISVSMTWCGANLSGTPPREGQEREGCHGGFDVVNLRDDPEPAGKRCKRCFRKQEG